MSRYPTPLMALHWLTALAVIIAYVTSGNPAKAKDALDVLMGQMHVISGLAVFALVFFRIQTRRLLGVPPALPAPRWQAGAAHAGHVALYALMFLVPLAGWAALADKAPAFTLFGAHLPLPDRTAEGVVWLGAAHQVLGNLFFGLAGLHAAAALAHHFLLHDRTLVRMLPKRRDK